MIYQLGNDFTQISETTGTIQNTSHINTVEMSNSTVEGSGILIYPLQTKSFNNKTIYLRCYENGGAEVRVIPFEVVIFLFPTTPFKIFPLATALSLFLTAQGKLSNTSTYQRKFIYVPLARPFHRIFLGAHWLILAPLILISMANPYSSYISKAILLIPLTRIGAL